MNMKKLIVGLLAAMFGVSSAMAQTDGKVRAWEVEVFAGPNVSIGESEDVGFFSTAIDSKALVGYSLGAELRHNFSKLPIDVGARFAFSKIGHNVEWQANEVSAPTWNKSYTNSFTLAAVGDWNFNRGGTVSPFVGLGAGVAFNKSYGTGTKPFVMPRVGIGINNRLRVSVSANLSDHAHNTMLLSLGYTFGAPSKVKVQAVNGREDMSDRIRKLNRQSNVCFWTGVGAIGVGLPTLTTGLVLIGMSTDEVGKTIGGVITGVGGLMTLSSVPLFIVSHQKKNEALRLSVQMSALSQPDPMQNGAVPALGLSLAF